MDDGELSGEADAGDTIGELYATFIDVGVPLVGGDDGGASGGMLATSVFCDEGELMLSTEIGRRLHCLSVSDEEKSCEKEGNGNGAK
jgi:hypothetical protein